MKNLFKFTAIFLFLAIFSAFTAFIFNFAVKIPVLSYCFYGVAAVCFIVAVILIITGYVQSLKKDKKR